MQIEELEFLLLGDNRDQRVHTAISANKPARLSCNGEALDRVEDIVSEGLQKLLAICCSGACPLDMMRVQTAAKVDNLSCKFEEQAAVFFCRVIQVCELQVLEVMCLKDELPQGPLFKLVLAPDLLDSEALKA